MQAVILAAGESSRFWPLNRKHKSLLKIMGRSLICRTIEGLKKAGVKDIIIVQGFQKDVEKELKDCKLGVNLRYVLQAEAKGTGHALLQARHLIKSPFLVLGPHRVDLPDYLPSLLKKFRKNQKKAVLLGVRTSRPWDFGVIQFQKGKIARIVENPLPGKEPSDIKTTEIYVFPQDFFDCLKKVPQKEDSLIDAVNLFIKDKGAEFIALKGDSVSLKHPWDLFGAMEFISGKGFEKHISPSAEIGKNAVIKGKVYIGDNAKIGENTVITGPCFIGDNCKIGPNNVLRGPVSLENNVATGAFAEIKHCIVQQGTHLHSGYLGDSIIGENCRFGAGFITANRRINREAVKLLIKGKKTDSGLSYFGCVVGDNSRFGIHSGTMPGVFIGSNCVVGPGTLVFGNLKDSKTLFTKFQVVEK